MAIDIYSIYGCQKLRQMVTSSHFEKVRGDVRISIGKCVEVWGEIRALKGRCGER